MASASECEAILAQLLDFSKPLDMALFDKVVDGFYVKGDMNLQQIIIRFTEHESAWTRVDYILENSSSNASRIIALNILETCVKTRWNILPAEQRDGIKNFVVNMILKISGDEKLMRQQQSFLNKLNVVLVQIAKNEWPKNWPTFITDLVESAKSSQSICSNNMQILLLLSEEVFDYSRDQMTSEKALLLKMSLKQDLAQVFALCDFVLGNSQNATLLTSTLRTLLRFLKWIPVEFIFETRLLEMLAVKFFSVPMFQVPTLQCLCEVAYLSFPDRPQYDAYFASMIAAVVTRVYTMYPPDTDLAAAYLDGDDRTQSLLRFLALFLTDYLRAHLTLQETASADSRQVLLSSLAVLLRLSLIDDPDSDVVVFHICLEYWTEFLRGLYLDERNNIGAAPLLLGSQSQRSPRLQFYEETLVNLRQVMIARMAKPEEVLVVTDEQGNVVREYLKNSDSINLYITMREALIFLTHLDPAKTMELMCGQLARLVASHEWAPELLNRLCWATGSISKALTEGQEKAFLARVIKDLLSLVDKRAKKDHKAIIAANIMYVVGQYPRFLKNHPSFLTTVVAKLFEFMHEAHPGVQDMACDTFLKIAHKCKSVMVSAPSSRPFIRDVLADLPNTIVDLEPAQLLVFYEAVAKVISAEPDASVCEQLVCQCMALPNAMWASTTQQLQQRPELLCEPETMVALELVLRTNARVAGSLKQAYLPQLSRLFLEMLQLYQLYSAAVARRLEQDGAVATRTVAVRKMRAIKKEVLRILTVFVEASRPERVFLQQFVPELLRPVLHDYQHSPPAARDHEVLDLFGAVIRQFGRDMAPHVPALFAALAPATLGMITANFEEHPEHRAAFFAFLLAVAEHCFPALAALQPADLKVVMDSIFWAVKHLDLPSQEAGLAAMGSIITQFVRDPAGGAFFSTYMVPMVNELLEALTDTFHKASIAAHCSLLARLIALVETQTVPLTLAPHTNNSAFLRDHIARLLSASFPHLAPARVQNTVTQLFASHADARRVRELVKDLLIELREFGSLEEDLGKQDQTVQQQAERDAQYAAVPGLQYHRGAEPDDE